MNQEPIPPIPHPVVIIGEPDDSVQWRASRAFGAFACVGLLIALWLPWFEVAAFIAGTNQQLTALGGFAPVTVTAWDISSSLAFAIAAATMLALYVAVTGPTDADGRWSEWAVGAYWLAAVIVLLGVCSIAFGIVSLPSSITERCASEFVGTVKNAAATPCTAGTAEIRKELLFGGGISVALALMLLGSAIWGTLRQPGRELPESEQ